MLLLAQLSAGLAALLHVIFFLFESIWWSRPQVYARFGVRTADQAATIRPMAYNQGFYNLALAIGVGVGVVRLPQAGTAGTVGRTLVVFGTACMTFAGLVLVTTGRQYYRAAAVQLVPAALGLVLTLVAG